MHLLLISALTTSFIFHSFAIECLDVRGDCMFDKCPGSDSIWLRPTSFGCPAPFSYCCAKIKDLDKIDEHLISVEGFRVKGYVPLPGSGATIATGYDIGNGPDVSRCLGLRLWSKLKPYRCCRTCASLKKAKLYPVSLELKVEEARKIDSCLKTRALRRLAPYTKSSTICGKAVLLSLVHWCGFRGAVSGAGNKCQASKTENYIAQCLHLNSGCSDMKLGEAVQKVIVAHERMKHKQWIINRLKRENKFLSRCREVVAKSTYSSFETLEDNLEVVM